jgi:hypothetical protein
MIGFLRTRAKKRIVITLTNGDDNEFEVAN